MLLFVWHKCPGRRVRAGPGVEPPGYLASSPIAGLSESISRKRPLNSPAWKPKSEVTRTRASLLATSAGSTSRPNGHFWLYHHLRCRSRPSQPPKRPARHSDLTGWRRRLLGAGHQSLERCPTQSGAPARSPALHNFVHALHDGVIGARWWWSRRNVGQGDGGAVFSGGRVWLRPGPWTGPWHPELLLRLPALKAANSSGLRPQRVLANNRN